MAELPFLAEALAAGGITLVHRDRILSIDNPRVHDAFVEDHAEMVEWARTQPWFNFCAKLQWWLFEHDPDGKDPGVESRGFDDRAKFEIILLDTDMRDISASRQRLCTGALRRMVLGRRPVRERCERKLMNLIGITIMEA